MTANTATWIALLVVLAVVPTMSAAAATNTNPSAPRRGTLFDIWVGPGRTCAATGERPGPRRDVPRPSPRLPPDTLEAIRAALKSAVETQPSPAATRSARATNGFGIADLLR